MRPPFLVFLSRFQRLTPFVLGLLLPLLAAAETASPINDNFAERIHLGSGNIHTNGTMLGASQESGERWIVFFEQKSVWWAWNATNSGPVTVAVDAVGDNAWQFSPFLSVEVSIGDSIVQLAQVATGASSVFYDGHLAPSVTFQAVSGRQYVIGLNGRGEIGEYALKVVQGLPPMVMVSAPHAGTVFQAGDSIMLSAQVLDQDSPVSHVTFYAGWGLNFSPVGTVQEWPFTLNWSNAPPGHYQVVVRGWDTTGLSGFSLPVTIDAVPVVPANDAFADRVALTGAFIDVIGTLVNASREEGEPLHVDNDSGSIWWSWTAPTNGFVTVTSDAWGLAVYTGFELGHLTLVTNALPGEFGSMAVFAATAGTTYAIAAIGSGDIQLHLRMSRPPIVTILSPTNGARFIVGGAIPVSVSAQDPEGALASLEVLLSTEPLVTNIVAGSFFTTVLSNLPAGGHVVWVTATDAEGLSARSYHPFQVEPVPIPPPLNDHYTNRFTITGAPLVVNGTTVGATTEPGEWGGYRSVWWRWVAPASGPTTVTLGSYPHSANIYTGDAISAFECVGRPSIFLGTGREVFQAQAGVAYQIRVYLHSHLSSPGEVQFQIVQSLPPTITLVSPTNGSQFFSGNTVELNASASDQDGVVSKVEFFSENNLLGTVTNAPFILSTSFQTDYTTSRQVSAVVTDNAGLSSRSAPLTLVIHPVPPVNDPFAGRLLLTGSSVSTTGSTEKATREAGEPGGGERSVWYSWTAPADGNYTFTVDGWLPNLGILAYTGTTLPTVALVGQSAIEPDSGPYRARLALDAVAGTLYQVAVIDAGEFSFMVSRGRPPSISITSPSDGVALLRSSPTAFAVSVNDLDGDLRKVDFYLNHALMATVTNSPFSVEFMAQGVLMILAGIRERYFLDAVATDEQGMETHALSVEGDITGPAVHPATNDNFANRIVLTGLLAGGILEQEATASVELGEPDWLADGGVGSTWWSWHAPAAGEVIIHCEAPFAVLTGSGTALSNLTLIGISQSSEWTRVTRFSAVAGTDYHIRVSTDYPGYRLQLLLSVAQPALLSAKGIENGAMRLNFQTLAVLDWTFQFSDNLRDWTPFSTNRARLQNFQVIDPAASARNRRFYRAVSER